MIKKQKSFSIYFLSVLTVLMALLISIVGSANAWFQIRHDEGIRFVANIGGLELSLYQDSISDDNIIYTYDKNKVVETRKYIDFTGKIAPEVENDLVLLLANDCDTSVPLYIRYKLQLYVRGVDSVNIIETTLSGFTAPTSEQNGVIAEDDGYYYYQNTSANVMLNKDSSFTMLTDFTIGISEFMDDDGNMLLTGGESVTLVLTVQGSIDGTF